MAAAHTVDVDLVDRLQIPVRQDFKNFHSFIRDGIKELLIPRNTDIGRIVDRNDFPEIHA